MKHTIYIIATVLFLIPFTSSAKSSDDLMRANYLYSHLAFSEAINYYQKLPNNVSDPEIAAKLGDCYRLTNDLEQAANWYGRAVTMGGCPDMVKLHYGQVLMTMQQYDNAKTMFKQYQQSVPNDRRVANLIKSCDYAPAAANAMPASIVLFQPFNTNGSDFGPAFRKNELFFTTDTAINTPGKTDGWSGHSFYKIYSVATDSLGNASGKLSTIGRKINTKYHDGPCTFNGDGSVMYFTRTNYVQNVFVKNPIPDKNEVVHLEIMVASDYDENKKEYKKVSAFPYNSKNYSTAHPTISHDGSILVFSSDMDGGQGSSDLYMCRKDNKGNWSKPVSLGSSINTEGDEMFPFIDLDNTLYFSSNGLVGHGGLDIYMAPWDATTGTFGTPVDMAAPLNSSYDDMSLALNPTGDAGYFASNRPAPMKDDNIYSYNKQQIFMSLNVVDSLTGAPLTGVKISIASATDKRDVSEDDRGNVFTQLYPRSNYTVYASRNGYRPNKIDLSTLTIDRSDTLRRTLKLASDFNIAYNAVVLDESTMQPIENPTVVLYNNKLAKADTVQLATGQVYTTSLKSGNTYNIYALKDNYYGNEKSFSTKDILPGAGNISINDTILMKKLKVGEVYKIDNIYYDFNKANIREDAKPSLDRLIEVLNKYPSMRIQVNSHTDCRGAAAYNLKLSISRARSVMLYLQSKGIDISRLQSKGYGKTMPVEKCNCPDCTEQQHQANRRTEFQILAM